MRAGIVSYVIHEETLEERYSTEDVKWDFSLLHRP